MRFLVYSAAVSASVLASAAACRLLSDGLSSLVTEVRDGIWFKRS